MLRRPNRASWHEESAGRPSPLAQLLASPQPLHAFHPDNAFVGARQNLPGQIGFGNLQQHPVSGTAFTGGRVANPQPGLVHAPQMPTMPTMAQANSHAGSSIAASLAALGLLAGTPHGGPATPTLPPGPGEQPPTEAPPSVRPINPTMTTGIRPTGTPDNGGGVAPPPIGSRIPTEQNPDVRPRGQTEPTVGGFDPNYRGGYIPLGQLLTSIGRRGVYNV